MISERFEDDLVELSGSGYLMLCRDRQLLFMEGSDASPVKLAEVESFRAQEEAIEIAGTWGEAVGCPFAGMAKAELEPSVAKLNQHLASWR